MFHRAWDDDFSAPRNLSIEKATGDWILVLDADEAIAANDLETLQALTTVPETAYEFFQRHYTNDQRVSQFVPCSGEYPEWERTFGGYFTSNLCRLFPRNEKFRFRNRVHELVEPSIYECENFKIIRSDIPIHHYGHSDEIKKRKKKSDLYTPLGSQKILENPLNWKNHFEVAVEYNTRGEHLKSVLAFRTAAALNPEYCQTWINLGYVLNELHALGSAVEALSRALQLEPANPEAHCNIAVTYMRLRRLPFAREHLLRALAEKPDYTNAICNLGQVYALEKQFEKAAETYEKAIELFPGNVVALTDLGAVLAELGRGDEAIEKLNKALTLDATFARAYFYLGHTYKKLEKVDAAIKTFEGALEKATTAGRDALLMKEIEKTCTALKQNPTAASVAE